MDWDAFIEKDDWMRAWNNVIALYGQLGLPSAKAQGLALYDMFGRYLCQADAEAVLTKASREAVPNPPLIRAACISLGIDPDDLKDEDATVDCDLCDLDEDGNPTGKTSLCMLTNGRYLPAVLRWTAPWLKDQPKVWTTETWVCDCRNGGRWKTAKRLRRFDRAKLQDGSMEALEQLRRDDRLEAERPQDVPELVENIDLPGKSTRH